MANKNSGSVVAAAVAAATSVNAAAGEVATDGKGTEAVGVVEAGGRDVVAPTSAAAAKSVPSGKAEQAAAVAPVGLGKPCLGRVVYYTLPDLFANAGARRAADIISDNTGSPTQDLLVKLLGNDLPKESPHCGKAAVRVPSVSYDANGAQGTWRWPERI
jgi:hypothetical protein